MSAPWPKLAVPVQPHVAGSHALDRTLVVIQHFGTGKTRINLDPQGFRFLSEPATEVGKAEDDIARVMKTRGKKSIGNPVTFLLL